MTVLIFGMSVINEIPASAGMTVLIFGMSVIDEIATLRSQ
jgi:hypothetical protein